MGSNSFRFKRFVVEQDECAMKVGTDGVLLGAWCRIEPSDKAILDIGTGTGVIALQLAQRTEEWDTVVDAVEIDPVACRQAQKNFDASGWGSRDGRDGFDSRLRLYPVSVQEFSEEALSSEGKGRYDHIVSNPPYFTDSLISPDPSRNLARHTGTLSYGEFISVSDRLLKLGGRISLILPSGAETEKMTSIAREYGFYVSRRTNVYTTPKSGPKRCLLEFSRRREPDTCVEHEDVPAEIRSIIIEDAGPGTFSEEYRALTRDFYLYF